MGIFSEVLQKIWIKDMNKDMQEKKYVNKTFSFFVSFSLFFFLMGAL